MTSPLSLIGEEAVALAIGGKYANVDLVRQRARAAISAHLAALTEAGLLREWRPIDTAPKDGTAVLVFASPFVFTAECYKDNWHALIGDEVPSTEDTSVLLDEVTRWGNPTHWMPLPAPPAQNGDEP